jgi:branched-chain amino acid transport system substrate-binding protein
LTILLAILPLLAFFTGCSKSAVQKPIVGALLAQSGENAQWGANARQGMQLILDQINADGGINGVPLQLIIEDSKGETREAITAFNKLRDLDHVLVVLGDIMSSTTLAVAPTANTSKTPIIGIGASAPAITQAGPYIYRVWPSDLYEGHVAAVWAASAGYKKAALVFINNEYGAGIKNAFKEQFVAHGGSIVSEQGFESDTRTFRDVASKIKGLDCDIVYVVGYYENTALMVKNLREVGVAAALLGTSSALNPKISQLAGTAAEGFFVAVVNDIDEENLTPVQKSFFDEYQKRFGQKPDWAAVKAADALLVAAKCLKEGARTGEDVKAKLDSIHTFKGISNEITFDEHGDVKDKPIVIRQLHGGTFVLYAVPKFGP